MDACNLSINSPVLVCYFMVVFELPMFSYLRNKILVLEFHNWLQKSVRLKQEPANQICPEQQLFSPPKTICDRR